MAYVTMYALCIICMYVHVYSISCMYMYLCVYVYYSAKDPTCQNGEVRLLGGVSSEQGRVEVCYNGVWGTMCGEDRWTHTEAAVICHQLGYNLTETSMYIFTCTYIHVYIYMYYIHICIIIYI